MTHGMFRIDFRNEVVSAQAVSSSFVLGRRAVLGVFS
jgi:hypothetical protein